MKMKINPLKITVGELAKNYQDNNEDGVIGLRWQAGYAIEIHCIIYTTNCISHLFSD
jgi:hypothetical protein